MIDAEIKVLKHTKFMYHIVSQIDQIYVSHRDTLKITIAFSFSAFP